MPYSLLPAGDQSWEERPPIGDGAVRYSLDVTAATGISESRARMWRLLPGARGRRHAEGAQEEVFYVVSGTLTMLLGDPPERVDVESGGIVAVTPGTGIQMHNTGDVDAVVFAYGAPPVTGQVDYLDDIEAP
jgi:mannose-6-phosphate isomerase-like protein (cupin superfamily)